MKATFGKETVRVKLERPDTGKAQKARRLDLYFGTKKVPIQVVGRKSGKRVLSGGITVTWGYWKSPPAYVEIKTPTMDVLVTLNSNNARPTHGLNVYLTVQGPVNHPVKGLLGGTYQPTAPATGGRDALLGQMAALIT